MNRKKREILLRGSSECDANILYFSGIQIPDPFFAFTLGGKRCALLSPLEAGRALRGSKFDEIFDISEVCARKKMQYSEFSALCSVLKSKKISALSVPENFPSKFYRDLFEAGFDIEIAESPFFCDRAIKSEYELGEITRANSAASAGFEIAEEILRLSKINRGRLFFESKPLTCEFLRSEIERAALSLGADSMHTIVAAGNDACDPHCEGSGVVRANSLIVMDIFPRLKKSGYYGDMTRTFLKGEPSAKQAHLVETVLDAQAIALSFLENLIPSLPFLPPGAKPGFSNIVTMFTVLTLGLPQAMCITVFKALFALMTRGATAFFMSLAGGVLSTLAMWTATKIKSDPFGLLGASIIAAVCHNAGQLAAAAVLTGTGAVLGYAPALLIFSLITGAVTGTVLRIVMPALEKQTRFIIKK